MLCLVLRCQCLPLKKKKKKKKRTEKKERKKKKTKKRKKEKKERKKESIFNALFKYNNNYYGKKMGVGLPKYGEKKKPNQKGG